MSLKNFCQPGSPQLWKVQHFYWCTVVFIGRICMKANQSLLTVHAVLNNVKASSSKLQKELLLSNITMTITYANLVQRSFSNNGFLIEFRSLWGKNKETSEMIFKNHSSSHKSERTKQFSSFCINGFGIMNLFYKTFKKNLNEISQQLDISTILSNI